MKTRISAAILSTVLLMAATGCQTNPTIASGRGKPAADDVQRPCAWIYVDGKSGVYRTSDDGKPLMQWFIDEPVPATPTFRVEVFDKVLGEEVEFKSVIQTRGISETAGVTYGLAAKDGTFVAGEEYNMLTPGENFVLRVGGTDKILDEAEPLAPGDYIILATIKGRSNGTQVLAATYFTVGVN